jgi:ferric-dicitrate binding protein FerR (iron transport regulator)
LLNANNDINDELLASYLLNEGDAAMRRRIETWIAEDPAHQRYFEHFRLIWEAGARLAPTVKVNEDEAWERFRKKTFDQRQRTSTIRGRFIALKIAATIIICVGVGVLSYLTWQNLNPATLTVASTLEPINKSLPDGSLVTLNKNSSIVYTKNFTGNRRRITLKGEAFFKVTPNKSKPFVIDVDDVTVTVVGTSFNIRQAADSIEVSVETGIVKVEKNNRSVLLKPNEKVIISGSDSTLKPNQTRGKLYNYYVTHEFVCDDTPLWKLVEVLNEAYGSHIEIANPDLRNLPLTATFHNEPLDRTLSIISETFSITVERHNEKIILK